MLWYLILFLIPLYIGYRFWWVAFQLSFYKIPQGAYYVKHEVFKICWYDHPFCWNFNKILKYLKEDDHNLYERYFAAPDAIVHEYTYPNLIDTSTGKPVTIKVGILPVEEENIHFTRLARIREYAKQCAARHSQKD